MRILSLLLLGLCLSFGAKIQVVKSTSQEWAGGLRESGYGTNYKLTIKVKAGSGELQFEDLWVGDTHMKVRVAADPAKQPGNSFARGSQVTLQAGITIRPDEQGRITLSPEESLKKPFNFKGEGLLGYIYKGHKAYLEITGFEKLNKIIYP
jgi:hypothetical protein